MGIFRQYKIKTTNVERLNPLQTNIGNDIFKQTFICYKYNI